MKELTIEEKAKRYDEALERAKKWYNAPNVDKIPTFGNRVIEEIFPELKESEDEKILNAIIKNYKGDYQIPTIDGVKREDALAWLEKQGKLVDEYEDRLDRCACESFNKGYKAAIEHQKEKQGEQKAADKIEKIPNGYFDYEHCDIQQLSSAIEEQKPADKVEPKFHKGDIIKPKDGGHEPWQIMQVDILNKKYRFKDGYVIHFSQEDNYELVENHAWSEEDENMVRYIGNAITCEESAKYLEEKGVDMIKAHRWLESLKPQFKQEWSGEDDIYIENIILAVKKQYPIAAKDIVDWLKSLKSRIHDL